ncbi:hypothetical protein SLE2022_192360 [Rubroshorea leprosula]
MFGEMIGVWAMCLWEQMGQPTRVNLVELGPGRGTLMADLRHGASKFKKFTDSLHVRMVDCSPTVQKLQHHSLICTEEDNNNENVEKRTIKYKHTSQNSCVMAYYTGTGSIRIANNHHRAPVL